MTIKAFVLSVFVFINFNFCVFAGQDVPIISREGLILPVINSFPSINGLSAFLPRFYKNDTSFSNDKSGDDLVFNWLRQNVSSKTGLFLSFYINSEEKEQVYFEMGDLNSIPGIIERTIVENGLVIYDGAVGQISLTLSGSSSDMRIAERPLDIYWRGELNDLTNIRAGFSNTNFIYDPLNPEQVSSDLNSFGKRGYIFRIINANGDYLSPDPLDGKTSFEGFPTWPEIHWEDWKPVSGENAWVVMAAMRIYHIKYFDNFSQKYQLKSESIELQLSEEIARAALMLQSEIGGIRMAPIGTFRENDPEEASGENSWWYNQISTENNLSWYAAFRMLYKVTGKDIYHRAMIKQEAYFQRVFNATDRSFYQGMNWKDGIWRVSDSDFAVDVQTWGILSLGAQRMDLWFGEGAAYTAWKKVKDYSATWDVSGRIVGVGYTKETGRVSVEWTAGAIMAARAIAEYYQDKHPDWGQECRRDADEMRAGMELLRRDISADMSAYSYSSKRGWIPFGWNSHDPRVMSLASTGWILFVDRAFNPFFIDGNK